MSPKTGFWRGDPLAILFFPLPPLLLLMRRNISGLQEIMDCIF
jgi:hypothetical protein